jgi:hypothetical protein
MSRPIRRTQHLIACGCVLTMELALMFGCSPRRSWLRFLCNDFTGSAVLYTSLTERWLR